MNGLGPTGVRAATIPLAWQEMAGILCPVDNSASLLLPKKMLRRPLRKFGRLGAR